MMMSITQEIEDFVTKLNAVEGSTRTATDNNVIQLASYLLQVSKRIDKIVDEDAEF